MRPQFENNHLEKSLWARAFPEQIQLYHLGPVTIEKNASAVAPSELSATDYFPLCFSFHGDQRGLLLLLLDRNLDLSLYSELGNLLASAIATELSNQNGIDVMISPPYSLNESRLRELLAANDSKLIRRTYLHQSVRVEAFILPSEASPEVGHA